MTHSDIYDCLLIATVESAPESCVYDTGKIVNRSLFAIFNPQTGAGGRR